MNDSQFKDNIECIHCGEHCTLQKWPVNGDAVPFYFEFDAGAHSVEVECSQCGKTWYVVWDSDPGPIENIDSEEASASSTESEEAKRFYPALVASAEMGIRSGIRNFEEFRSHVRDTIGGSMPKETLETLARKAWEQAWSRNR